MIASSVGNRQGALGRSVVGYVGRELGDYQIKGIAEHFNRDPVVISQGIKRLEKRLTEEKGLANKTLKIEKSIVDCLLDSAEFSMKNNGSDLHISQSILFLPLG